MFKLRKLDIPDGKKPIYLLIEQRGEIPFLEFKADIQKGGNYEAQMDAIDTRIHSRSVGEPIPPKKFKSLEDRPKSDRVTDFEYKTPMLRVYSFEFMHGEVIWGGEIKDPKKQDRTIARMRDAKRRFYEQVKTQGVTIEDEDGNRLESVIQNTNVLD